MVLFLLGGSASAGVTCATSASGVAAKPDPVVYVIMAPSSLGKSTLGKRLARYLNAPFYEPDDFHSEENRKKISDGIPLTDDDRWPWLDNMRVQVIDRHLASRRQAVMANSALKREYRRRLGIPQEGVQLIYIQGTQAEALANNGRRQGHFAPEQTVINNFRILQEPLPEEDAWIVRYDGRGPDYTFENLVPYLQNNRN